MHFARACTLAGLVLVLALATHSARAALMPSHTPCVAHGNGSLAYDIRTLFDWPIAVDGTDMYDSNVTYWLSPCTGQANAAHACASADVGVCQQVPNSGDHFALGNVDSALWFGPFNPVERDLTWTVMLPYPASARVSFLVFVVDEKVLQPTVEFVSEDPELSYTFKITGVCIGNPWVPSTREPCHYAAAAAAGA